MQANNSIIVVPYNPEWPQQFQAIAQPLRQALGPVALRIDHIGSTSIPGLAAKPIIDIQISVEDFEPLAAFKDPLENLGYIFRAANSERTKRYFREPQGHNRIHIHVRRIGTFSQQLPLLFRDYLRLHSGLREEYAVLKMELAQKYNRPEDRHLYTNAKDPLIWQILAQGDRWAQETGWFHGPSDV